MHRLASYLTLAVLSVSSVVAADSFEGKLTMSVSSAGRPAQSINYEAKGTQLRVDVAAGARAGTGASIIMDFGKQQMTILMAQQKMYMVRPIPGFSAEPSTPPGATSRLGDSLVDNGVSEKILGYNCRKYTTTAGGQTTEIWLTNELGVFNGFGGGLGGRPGASPASAWEKALKGKAAFPMRVISKDSSGAEKTRLEVTAVAKENLPDSAFLPPADYREFNMGNMMGGH